MTTEDALLAAIIAHPAEDVPRLAYADWLDEHGHPERAEFIRLQCERVRLPAVDRCHAALEVRERALQAAHEHEWTETLRALGATGWQFHRGFVEDVTLEALALLEHADALFRLTPVRGVRLHDVSTLMRALAVGPRLAGVTSLDLSSNVLHDDDVRDLAESPYLAQLSTLRLRNCTLFDHAIAVLAGAPGLAHLTTLDIADNHFGDDGILALAGSVYLGRLTTLDLGHPAEGESLFGCEAVLALASSSRLPHLAALELTGARHADWSALLALPHVVGGGDAEYRREEDPDVELLLKEIYGLCHTNMGQPSDWLAECVVCQVIPRAVPDGVRLLRVRGLPATDQLEADAFLAFLGYSSHGEARDIGLASARHLLLVAMGFNTASAEVLADRFLALFPAESRYYGHTNRHHFNLPLPEGRFPYGPYGGRYGPNFPLSDLFRGVIVVSEGRAGMVWVGEAH